MNRRGSPFTVLGSQLIEKAVGLDFINCNSIPLMENQPQRRMSRDNREL